MKLYVVVEHCDQWGGVPLDMGSIIRDIFADRRRAEDYVRGMVGYMGSYEGQTLLLEDGKAHDGHGTTYFEIIQRELYLAE